MVEILIDQIFEDIVETIREPLLILDSDLKVILASRSFYEFFKVKPEETVGQLIYDLGSKQWNIPKLRELLETILPQKTTFDDYEVEHDFATIGRRIMLLNARQIERGMGEERIILLAIEDITARRDADVLLSISEEQYRRLFETADDGILLLEKSKLKIRHANPAIMAMLGYSNEELIGKDMKGIGFPDDIGTFQEIMQTLNKDGISHCNDVAVQNKAGQSIYTDIYMTDRSILVQCNIREITERKRAKDALQESKEELKLTLDATTDGIWKWNFMTNELYFSPRYYTILGYEPDEFSSNLESWQSLIHPDDLQSARGAAEEYLKNKPDEYEREFRLRTKNGDYRWIRTRAKVVERNEKGEAVRMIGNHEDITERKQAEEALRESEEALRRSEVFLNKLLDAIPIPVFYKDRDGKYLEFNTAFENFFGNTKEQLVGKSVFDINPPELAEIYHLKDEELIKSGGAQLYESQVKNAQGKLHDVIFNKAVFTDNNGTVKGLIGAILDITERKKIEGNLRKSEKLHKEAQRVAKIGHWELDSPSGTPTWSEEIFHICGLDPKKSEPSFAAHANIIHDEDWGILDNSIQELSTNGTPFDLEFRIVRPNGEIRWMHARGSADKSEDGRVTRMFGTAQDITERKLADAELRESEKRLRSLAFQLIDAQEKERRRISQELHDEMGQVLTAIVLNLTEIENQMSSDKAQILKNIFADTHSLLDQTSYQIRELAYSLRPTMLDDLGLLPTLRWHFNSFTKRTDIAVNFKTIALDDRMDATIETVLYRIAQESLNNIIKHADAKKVTVTLENKGKTITLTIEDDGKGFDLNEINARRASEKKIGLLGMEERTALLGGKFLIQSQKGHGTLVFVEIPLHARGV